MRVLLGVSDWTGFRNLSVKELGSESLTLPKMVEPVRGRGFSLVYGEGVRPAYSCPPTLGRG